MGCNIAFNTWRDQKAHHPLSLNNTSQLYNLEDQLVETKRVKCLNNDVSEAVVLSGPE